MAAKKTPKAGARAATTPAAPARLSPPSLKYEFLVAALVMVVAICALYPQIVFQDKIFFAGDTQAAVSFSTVGQRALEDGAYPVWNPYIFSGMPSYSSLSYTPWVYPVSFVLGIFVKYLFFPHYTWLLFHTWLMGMGTYLLLRDRRVYWGAGMAAGVLMMWMPNLVAVGANGHGSQACASGYLPFALLFWDRIWRGKDTVASACALSLVLGLSMLRGHVQISYYTYALVALHLIFFGALRLVDGMRGRAPSATMLPRRFYDRLTGGGSRYSVGPALAECAWAVALFAVVAVASLLMSSVLHTPAHDYAQYSIRGASGGGLDYGYATSWSLHPVETLTFLFPFAMGFGKNLYYGYMPFTDYPNYVGVIVFAMAVAALFLVRNRFVKFLWFIVLVATFTAFGRFFPVLYGPLFKFAPFFDKFRVPVMVLIVQQLAFVLLFGIGLDALLRIDVERGKRIALRATLAALAIFVVVVISQGYWTGDFAESVASRIRQAQTAQQQLQVARLSGGHLGNDLIRFAVMLLVVCLLFFSYFRIRRPGANVVVAVVLLIGVIDFYLVDRHILHPEVFWKTEQLRLIRDRSVVKDYVESDDVIEFLAADKEAFRVFPMSHPQNPTSGLFRSNRFMNFGISSLGGYHPAKLSAYEEVIGALNITVQRGSFRLANILNARYIVSASRLPETPGLELAWTGTDYQGQPRAIYRNTEALPRAWFADKYQVVTGFDALRVVAAGAMDVASSVVLDRKPSIEPVSKEGATAVVEKRDFNEIVVQATTPSACLLVLSEVYYPQWKVTVDGEPAEMYRANHIVRAVALPAGEHRVEFRYDTSLIRNSAVVSAASMGTAILILLAYLAVWLRSRIRGSSDLHTDV